MKKFILILLILLALTLPAKADYSKLPEPMVGQTTVEFGGSTSYGGFTGNEAVLNHTQSGKTAGNSLSPSAVFNGTNYIDAGNTSNFTGTGPISISLWVKRNQTGAPSGKESIFTQTNGGYCMLNLFFDTDKKLHFDIFGTTYVGSPYDNGHKNIHMDSTFAINDTAWHHVVVTRSDDGLNGNMWIDGVPSGQNINDTTNCVLTKFPLPSGVSGPCLVYLKRTNPLTGEITHINIGRQPDFEGNGTPRYYFNGGVSTIRTYDKALIQGDVDKLYKENGVDSLGTPKAFWKLNDGSGTAVKDYSLTNNTATFNNSVWNDAGPLISSVTDSNEMFGFNQANLMQCLDGIILGTTVERCFVKNVDGGAISVMNSRTYVNNFPSMELAALYYGKNTIVGDVYGSMDNFAFWGRNLNQNGSNTSDATWKLKPYSMNSAAQSTMSGTQYDQFKGKIDAMKGEATLVNASDLSTGGNIYLQTNNISIKDAGTANNNYPDGRIWKVSGNLAINPDSLLSFNGKGTIIVDGNLTINSGVNITPADSSSRLGFIVYGDVNIGGNNKVQTLIIAMGANAGSTGTILVSNNNVEAIGSFVAKIFRVTGTQNIRFYYDYGLNSAWPPGFRYLNMPHATE